MDIRQFAYAGIDVYGLLADYLGVSTAEIQEMQSSGKITYDMLSGALRNASKEGGRFAGAMEKQSKTINGMISNFKDNIGNLAGDLSSGFTDALKNILPPINNMIDRIDGLLKTNPRFIEFSQNVANVFKTIGNVIDKLSDDQLNSIIDMFVALAKTGPLLLGLGAILPKVGTAIDLFLKPTSGIVGFIKQLVQGIPIISQAVNIIDTLASPLMSLVTGFFKLGTGLTAVVGVLGYLDQQMNGKITEWSKMFAKVVPEIIKRVVNKIKVSLPQMVKQGQVILGNIIKGISDSLPSLIEMLDTLFEVVNDTMATNGPQIAELVTNGAMKILQSVYKSEPGFVNAVMKILEGMMKALRDNLPQTLVLARQTTNQTIQVLVDNLPEFIALGSEVIMALIQGLVDSIPQMIDQIPVMVNLFVNTMLGLLYLYVQVGYKIVLSIIQGIQSYAQNIPNVGNQIMNNLKNSLLNWLGQFLQIGTRLVQSMGTGVSNAVNYVTSRARNVIWQVVSSFNGYSLWNTGYNLIVGLWNGMGYMKNWIVSKAQNLAYSVINAVRRVFGVHSPSTEFAWVGEMNMEGLYQGMDESQSKVQGLIDTMFNLQPNVSPMMTIQRESEDYSIADAINNMQDRPVVLDIRADEGIIVQKATQGFREFQRANGRLPF